MRDHRSGLEYVHSMALEKHTLAASRLAADWAEVHFPETLASIQQAEVEKGAQRIDYIDWRVGSTIIMSVNLANAAHYDINDDSRCFAIFVEKIPGDATNWFLVFPNISYNGSKGLVIRLTHGTAVDWDGLRMKHATSRAKRHPNNGLFGMFFGSCR